MNFSLLQKAIIKELRTKGLDSKDDRIKKQLRVIFLKHFRDRSYNEIIEDAAYSEPHIKKILRDYGMRDEDVYSYSLEISPDQDKKEFNEFLKAVLDK